MTNQPVRPITPPAPSIASLQPVDVLNDNTKQELRLIGWNDGDPIPPTLSEFLSGLAKRFPSATAGSSRDIRPISQLPEVARQMAADFLADYKRTTGGASAMTGGFLPVSATDEQLGSVVLDVDPTQLPQASTLPPTPPTVSPTSEETESTTSDSETGADVAVTTCPRCAWRMSDKFPTEPTKDDVDRFVLSLLGDRPFKKRYDLLGGRVSLTFASLTSGEAQLIRGQLSKDVHAAKIIGHNDYLAAFQDYRLVCMLKNIVMRGEPVIAHDLPEDVSLWGAGHLAENQTVLDAYVTLFHTKYVKNDSLLRMARLHAFEFSAVCEKLESMAADQNFWNGIHAT